MLVFAADVDDVAVFNDVDDDDAEEEDDDDDDVNGVVTVGCTKSGFIGETRNARANGDRFGVPVLLSASFDVVDVGSSLPPRRTARCNCWIPRLSRGATGRSRPAQRSR